MTKVYVYLADPGAPPGANPFGYNQLVDGSVVGTIKADLQDDTGAATGWSLSVANEPFDNEAGSGGVATSGVGEFTEEVLDNWWQDAGNAQLEIGGLPVGDTYTLQLIGHNGNSRDTNFSVTPANEGTTTYVASDDSTPAPALTFTGTIGAGGTILIEGALLNVLWYINGFILEVTAAGGGTAPAIADAGDEVYKSGDSVTITGSNFEAVQNNGRVVISPTDDINDLNAQTQVATAWADGSITFVASRSPGIGVGTAAFLFVENDSGNSNASGYLVQFEWRVELVELIENKDTTPWADETGLTVEVWRNREPAGAPDQTLTNVSLSATGFINEEIENTGLNENDPVWVKVFEDDPVNWKGTLVKLVPRYT